MVMVTVFFKHAQIISRVTKKLVQHFKKLNFETYRNYEAYCLMDKPVQQKFSDSMVANPSPGLTFSVDQQCQFVFGPSASLCPYMVRALLEWVLLFDDKKFSHVYSPPAKDYGAPLPTDTRSDVEHSTCLGQTVRHADIVIG